MDSIIDIADKVFVNTYTRNQICLIKGQGVTLWDSNGKSYTDFLAGIAVCVLGHCHPAVAKAVSNQAKKLVHVSNLFYTEPQTELAQKLVELCFADQVFFCNSGAEANEAAIKLARKYFKDQDQPERYQIIAMKDSFHGRTMATIAATGQKKIQAGFEPMVEGFDHVAFNDIKAVEKAVTDKTCAIITEPIQAEGGIITPDSGYLKALRDLCDNKGILLIYDEVQTGMCRTGTFFAHEQMGAAPDIMTLAKGLANGLPIGAMLATQKVGAAFTPGSHASTFGGTPLVTAAALAVIKAMEDEKILENVRTVSAYFSDQLNELKQRHACIEEIRGMGLILGLKLKVDAAPYVKACMEKGYLINCAQPQVLRFVPPLIIEKQHVDGLISVLDEILPGS